MWKNDYSRRLVLANRQAKVSKDFTFSYVHVKKKKRENRNYPGSSFHVSRALSQAGALEGQ